MELIIHEQNIVIIVQFTEHLLYGRYCARSLTHIIVNLEIRGIVSALPVSKLKLLGGEFDKCQLVQE